MLKLGQIPSLQNLNQNWLGCIFVQHIGWNPICRVLKESVRIFVSVPPRIVDSLSSSDMVQTEGSNVTLECVASGSPQPAVVWRREDSREIEINKNTTGGWWWWWWWSDSHCHSIRWIYPTLRQCLVCSLAATQKIKINIAKSVTSCDPVKPERERRCWGKFCVMK